MKVIETGGKTLQGRQRREWYQGQNTVVWHQGIYRTCEIIRFAKRDSSRVLIRYTQTGKTQWVGLYDIRPEVS